MFMLKTKNMSEKNPAISMLAGFASASPRAPDPRSALFPWTQNSEHFTKQPLSTFLAPFSLSSRVSHEALRTLLDAFQS